MQENLFDLISFVGAIQGVLLSIVLFTRSGKEPAPFFLASYVFFFSIGLLEPWVERTLSNIPALVLLSFLASSNYLYGPLLYLFVHYLMGQEELTRKQYGRHFLPFACIFVAETSLSLSAIPTTLHEIFRLLAFEGLVVHIMTYNIRAIQLLTKHRSQINALKANTRWVGSMLMFITAIYALSFLISHLLIFGWEAADNLYLLVQVCITVTIYLMTYRLILYPQLFFATSSSAGEQNQNFPKYVKSGLKDHLAQQYLNELDFFMSKEKPYLDPDLSIYALSAKLNISRNHLTQIINEKLNKNFYEYINTYRVEEAKRMIRDPAFSHLNLTGIGLESGFKSKTAFNINFKKIAGCTPTEWKKTDQLTAGNV